MFRPFPFACASFVLQVLLIAGCDCGGTPPGGMCRTARECDDGQVCTDGRCMARSTVDARVPGIDGGDGGGGGGCMDFDRDSYGTGCSAGPDCDDSDAARGGPERCDTVDNDCDGMTDEGLADICTTCTPACEVDEIPGAGGWMPTAENSEGVIIEGGALTLGRMTAEAFSVWVANSDEGTVSKMDSRTNRELARYPSVGAAAPAGTRPWAEQCGWCDATRGGCIGNCASRTAVDQNFDAYVANRAFGNQGSVTKYANQEADCIDRNASGVIDTSRDLNGDGSIALTPVGIGNEFVGPDDECILWTAPVGSNVAGTGGVPRALTIGVAAPDAVVGDVWVGLYNDQQACRLSPSDGSLIACIPINGIRPYGGASDAMGRIWFVDRTGARRDLLGYVDPGTMAFTMASPVPDLGCPTASLTPYGITPDADGRIYIASTGCEPALLRYSPATDTWDGYTIPGGGTPRGVAADETHLWIGLSHNVIGFGGGWANRIAQFRLSDMAFIATHSMPTGLGPVGVGVSFDGSVWAVCQGSNSAARLDPAAGTWIEHGVGLTPYTYSDFIGFGLNTFAQPRGRYRFQVEGCEGGEFGGQQWLGARVTASIPAMTSVELWARTSNSLPFPDVATLPFIGPFPAPVANFRMAPGPVPAGRYVEIEVRLRTDDRRVAPRVMAIDVAGECASSSM